DTESKRDQRRDAGDDRRVLDEGQIALIMDDVSVVRLDLRPVEMQRRRNRQHVDPALEGQDQQVDEGSKPEQTDQNEHCVGDDAAEPMRGHVVTSNRRTLTTRNSSVIPMTAAITIT